MKYSSTSQVAGQGRRDRWAVVILSGFLSVLSPAEGQFTYTIDQGAATITGAPGLMGFPTPLEIPSEIGGIPVTRIGEWAFSWISLETWQNSYRLTRVTIPDTVTNIGDHAFFYSPLLTTVWIGKGLMSISPSGFAACSNLTSMYFQGNAPTVDASVFSNDPAVVYYLPGTTGWGSTLGGRPTVLLDVEGQFQYEIINGTITITHYNGPGGVLVIPDTLFGVPVTAIADSAFSGWRSLASVTIPDSVTAIGNSAFVGCGLTNLVLGNGLTTIGDFAFFGTGLEAVGIPKTVTAIGEQAFSNLPNLLALEVDPLNPAYCSADGVLFNRDQTTLIQYPIGRYASFYAIPFGVTTVGNGAFTGCGGLTNVSIPATTVAVGHHAFWSCNGLVSVSIPDSVTSIGDFAFGACEALTSVSIGNGVTNIGASAFYGDAALVSLTLGYSVNRIGDEAFAHCGLSSVQFPNSLAEIGVRAFTDCTKLTGLNLPFGLTRVGAGAFRGTAITHVTIPGSAGVIGDGAFAGCGKLTSIMVDPANPAYGSIYQVLFTKDQATLVQYPGGKAGSYIIPTSVTNIGNSAFDGCTSLSAVIVPDSVFRIGDSAFSGCTLLAQIGLPGELMNLGEYAFAGCTSLTSVTIPGGVNTVSPWAFASCPNLSSVTLGSGIMSIENWAFYNCYSLKAIMIPDRVVRLGDEAFNSCVNLTNVDLGRAVTSIGAGAFESCTNLVSVTIPASVRSLGDMTFAECTALNSVFFRGDAPSAGSSIFYRDLVTPLFVTVYYLPGTEGWTNRFAGRPTVPWLIPNPVILSQSSSFGARSNGFGFVISWATNASVVVEASETLGSPRWRPLQTNQLSGGTCSFTDSDWTNHVGRFYRIRSP